RTTRSRDQPGPGRRRPRRGGRAAVAAGLCLNQAGCDCCGGGAPLLEPSGLSPLLRRQGAFACTGPAPAIAAQSLPLLEPSGLSPLLRNGCGPRATTLRVARGRRGCVVGLLFGRCI